MAYTGIGTINVNQSAPDTTHALVGEAGNDCAHHIRVIHGGGVRKDVSFGWGFLGHLDRGGRFLVQQADVGNHEWQMTHMELAFTGKVLFVKKLNIRSTDSFSDFHPVGRDLTFAQGVALLEKEAGRKQSQASAPKHDQAESKLQRKSGTNQESSKPSAVTTRQASTGISRPG